MDAPITDPPSILSVQNDPILQSGPGAGLDRFLRALRRDWPIFAAAVLLVLVLGIVLAASLPRQFTAGAVVMAAPRQTDQSVNELASGRPQAGPREADVEGEIQLMSSPAALRNVVRELGLVPATAARPGSSTDSVSVPDEAELTRAVDRVAQRLRVAPVGRSTMVKIEYTAANPALARDVANAVARHYIERRFEARLEYADRTADWLRERSAALQADVVEAERRLAEQRARSVIRGRDLGQLTAELGVLNGRLVEVRAERERAAGRVAAAEERVRRDGILSLLDWENAAGADRFVDRLRSSQVDVLQEVARLRIELGENSPAVQRLDSQVQTIREQLERQARATLEDLRTTLDAARRTSDALEAELRSTRADVDKLELQRIELGNLERQAEASRAVHEASLNRWKSISQVGFNDAESWLVSPAANPLRPSSPNVLLILAASFVAAMGVGVSVVLYREFRAGRTIRSARDVLQQLHGAQTLGLVPELRGRRRRAGTIGAAELRSDRLGSEAVGSIYASLLTSVGLSRRGAGPRGLVVLVTSALPREGRSTTATALAVAGAASGDRVAAVDCDLRTATLHRAFAVQPSPGLLQLMESGGEHEVRLQPDPVTGVSVLPAGTAGKVLSVNPAAVLRSEVFRAQLDQLRRDFDLIVLDVPPVLSVADSKLLAGIADRSILVVHWGRTLATVAELALSTLQRSGAVVSGVVLSRVDLRGLAALGSPEAEAFVGPSAAYIRVPGGVAGRLKALLNAARAGRSGTREVQG